MSMFKKGDYVEIDFGPGCESLKDHTRNIDVYAGTVGWVLDTRPVPGYTDKMQSLVRTLTIGDGWIYHGHLKHVEEQEDAPVQKG